MSQSSCSSKVSVIVTVPESLSPVVEKVEQLLEAVSQMPRGGDLEGLIESHLGELNRQFYDLCLSRREAAGASVASEGSEGFPPSGLPAMPGGVAAQSSEGAGDPDAARGGVV